MRRHATLLLALMLLTSVAALAQGRVINTFPYSQDFSFVTSGTTAFPTTNVAGGEFTTDAGTNATFTTTITNHGIHNNGGGSLRLQSTGNTGPAGIVWYGNFTGKNAGTLSVDWAKLINGTAGTRLNELRIATNGGSGSTFTDIAGVTWPQFDNSTTAQSGTLTVQLPPSLTNASDVRIQIYSVNIGGSNNHPRVIIDNLWIGCPVPSPVSLNAVSSNTTSTTTFSFTSSAPADSIIIIRRAGAAPTSTPTSGTRYTVGQGLSATDTVAYVGPTSGGTAEVRNLQAGTTYHYAVYSLSTCNATYSASATTATVTTLACSSAPGQITGVMDVSRTQTSVTLDYVRSLRTDTVLVIRRLRTAPTTTPLTDTRYAAGQGLSATDTVAYFGPAADLITASGLQADSLYWFAVYGFQTCNGAYSTLPGLDSARTYCPALNPIGNVTDLQLLYTTPTTAGFAVTAPTDVRSVIIFSRGADTNLPVPTNGRVYNIGDVVGDDTVRYVGTSTRPIVTGLNPITTYNFFALALLPCNFRYSALGDGATATTLARCTPTTPGVIDSLRITRNVPDSLRLSWRRAAGADRYLVVARIDSTPTVGPINGTWYAPGDSLGRATVLANVGDSTALITGIPRNTALFIRVYAFTSCALDYGASSPVFPMATIGTDSSQRFALQANVLDTISFGGATIEFAEAPSADGSVLIVRRRGHPGTLGIPMQRNNEPVVNAVSADRWWQLTRNGLGEFDVRLLFDVTGLPGMQDTNDLEIIYRPTTVSSWTDIRTEGWDSAAGRTWLYSNVQPFVGEYAIGANFANNVLPVKLTSFEGYTRGRENILRWTTASEENNAGFRLSRSVAGAEEFVTIADHTTDARLVGAGTTSDARRYGFVDADRALVAGSRYVYRLEEIALDGQVAEIGRVAVEMRAVTGVAAASIAPNPATSGSMTTLRFSVAEEGPLTVTLVDVTGATVRTILAETASPSGERALAFPLGDLAAGTYFCQITTASGRTVVPVTVAR